MHYLQLYLRYHTIPASAFPCSACVLASAHGIQGCLVRTTVMGIDGALGKMNLTSSNFDLARKFCANEIQPAPESPRPWAMITVAVCFETAGTTRGLITVVILKSRWSAMGVSGSNAVYTQTGYNEVGLLTFEIEGGMLRKEAPRTKLDSQLSDMPSLGRAL